MLSSGVAFTFPTGPDTLGNVDPYYQFDNVGHHGAVQPWLGWYHTSRHSDLRRGFFTQGFVALDIPFDTDDCTYLFLDLGAGYRIPRYGNRLITAITPMVEAHWSDPLNNREQAYSPTPLAESLGIDSYIMTPGIGQSGILAYRNQVNITTAVNLEIADSYTLVLGAVVPTVGPRVMDIELIAQVNVFCW